MMKNLLTKNLGIKLIALVLGFLIWLFIINFTNPTITKKFEDIPVQIVNESVISSANQVYTVKSGDKVDVVVKGKRNIVESLNSGDFEAIADLSKLSTVNTAGIEVKVKDERNKNLEIDWNNEVLSIKLEKKVTQQFKVKVITEGELAENYILGPITVNPSMIEVSGAKSQIKKIDAVGAVVQLDGQNKDFEKEPTAILYDADGEVLDGEGVSLDKDSVDVKVNVLPTKTIPVKVLTRGTVASGYSLTKTDFKPESIQVSGDKNALSGINEITIPVDVDGARRSVEKEVDLESLLPSSATLADDFTTVSIKCNIVKKGIRKFKVSTSDITVKNLPNNLAISYDDEDESHNVVVVGEESKIKDLTLSSLKATIDLKGMSVGSHKANVNLTLPNGVKLRRPISVKITLEETEIQSVD
ncbi:CdaR family protein [Eubacterium xylanophilum]|uniref:CdaR family protein n=1 Tax=Eubacterium xylanophilum TaxID=39497 RepID=UPI0004AD931D|nr:CdaR family protein [Eubacterium xylanophilum]